MSNDFKRIAIVVDRHDSALGTAAHNRAKVDPGILVLAAMDYQSPRRFLQRLEMQSLDLVIFSWRFVAWEIMILEKESQRLNSLPGLPKIAILIPDHLGTLLPTKKREKELLEAIDYFLVTSLKLAIIYSNAYPSKFRGVLHDLPSVDLIQGVGQFEADFENREGVTWIGNSKWGHNLGLVDYKGYHEIVLPMASALRNVPFRIIDSARKIKSHQEVLAQLSQSKYLIQASKDEGTGLPLLEAMGLGTIPITTSVGVAEEVLPADLKFLIVNRNPEEFLACYSKLETMDSVSLSSKLQVAYKHYLEKAKHEPLYFPAERSSRTIDAGFSSRLVVRFKWFLRYLRHGSE